MPHANPTHPPQEHLCLGANASRLSFSVIEIISLGRFFQPITGVRVYWGVLCNCDVPKDFAHEQTCITQANVLTRACVSVHKLVPVLVSLYPEN